jgi:hypothetical protein
MLVVANLLQAVTLDSASAIVPATVVRLITVPEEGQIIVVPEEDRSFVVNE